MTTRVAINGLGRIGRAAVRRVYDIGDQVELVAINDPGPADVLAYLICHDTVHGRWQHTATASTDGTQLEIGSDSIPMFHTRDVTELPWDALNVDVVLECTGAFRDHASASAHIEQGADRVVISAPASDPDVTICMGVNEQDFDPASHTIISNASCTTNCLAPVAKVLHEAFGIEHGFMTTVHAYTQDQRVLDATHKDLRRARSAAQNIIPTTTGAAKAIGLVLPELKGRMDGMSMRVPVPDGSVVDLVANLGTSVDADTVNDALRAAADGPLKQYLRYSEEPIVSSDIIGDPASSVVDGLSTMANGNHVKVIAWYDNEWGYTCRLVDAAIHVGAKVAA